MTAPKLTAIGPRLPVVIDPAQITPTGEGCPRCPDHPAFPRTHCGRPGCRDEQAIAWARQTGQDPGDVLDNLGAAGSATSDGGGLCSRCAMAVMCVVGQAVTTTAGALDARVSACQAFRESTEGDNG